MRSRYSAFAVGDAEYILRSWAPETRGTTLERSDLVLWTGLVIHHTTGGGPFDQFGTVLFSAGYDSDSGHRQQTENSLFRRNDGDWVYVGPAPD
jgi:SEC-C motif-containing protein